MATLAILVPSLLVALSHWARHDQPPTERRQWTRDSATIGALWLAGAALAAAVGLLRMDIQPPPLFVLVATGLIITVLVAGSWVGRRTALGVPLWALVGFHGFRLPLELLMSRAAAEGVMPVQMSFHGYNFDILTGASALLLLPLLPRLRRPPRALLWLWNTLGLALLCTIIAISVASTPRFHAFGERPEQLNTWVTYFPFVWLPTVLVPQALFGHILLLHRLRATDPG